MEWQRDSNCTTTEAPCYEIVTAKAEARKFENCLNVPPYREGRGSEQI